MFDGNGVLVNFLDTQIALVEADEGIVFIPLVSIACVPQSIGSDGPANY